MKLSAALALAAAPSVLGRIAPSGLPLGEIAWGDFVTLACNANLETAQCVPWSSMGYDLNNVVTIDCGVCVEVDVSVLDVFGGMNIIGHLKFPENFKGTLTTPFMAVQGKLTMSSTEPVTDANGAKDGLNVVLTGDSDVSFYPHGENAAACQNIMGESCAMGKKSIAVFGGELDIRGLPDTCPTWVKLVDVVTSDEEVVATEFPVPPVPATGCGTGDIVVSDFDNGAGDFKKALGTSMELLDGDSPDGSTALKVGNRVRNWQGAFINMRSLLRDCVLPDEVYLFKARVKLVKSTVEAGGSIESNCMSAGTDCPALNLHAMSAENQLAWKTLYQLPGVAAVQDGEWFDMVAPITFTAEQFDPTSKYQQLYIAGPESGVDMYLDDVSIVLPGAEFFPDASNPLTLCDDLIVNGDAETSPDHFFPWVLEGNRGAHLSLKTETVDGVDNQYFSVEGRNKMWTSIKAVLLHDCIVANSIYKFKARVRLHSTEPAKVRLTIRSHLTDPVPDQPAFKVDSVGDCPPVSGEMGWVECERSFLFQDRHQSAVKIEFIFVVEGDDTSDIDYDDISVVRSAPPIGKIIVPGDVSSCWGVGAEILTTSHTLTPADHNVDTIKAIETTADGNAVITLTNKIAKPTTMMDDPDYAVEVALLSRNIKFEAADDDPVNPAHGGHLMVVHTPGVPQTIHGVEFRKFGQQGNLGRYPIHIHLNVDGSGVTISRNTIRESNQRCVVIHGTHNTTITWNVAFDTFGHCYMLEDGIEQENYFGYNLGASTKITPDEGILSIAESDMFASTFWLSNPHNYIEHNVAAGAEDSGFWIELLELVRGPSQNMDPYLEINPSSHEYGYFRNNIAHSNKGDGLKLYPNGYFPETEAVFENTYSYRNVGDGVLLHNSKNLAIDGGIYADNRIQIEVDKQADDVRVSNAQVIGFSPLYQIEVEAGNRKSHCPAYRPLVGIQLHSFLRYRDSDGYIIENITFSDYGESIGCTDSSAIEMDPQTRDGHFDAFATFANLTFQDGMPMKEKFNMCFLAENEMFLHDLAIQDLSGDLNPNGNGVAGWILSDSPKMTAFLEEGTCFPMEGSCAIFCEGGCFRTMNYAINVAAEYDNLVLEATHADGRVTEFEGYFEAKTTIIQNVEVPDDYENFVYQRRKYFSPILPDGEYTLRFKKDGAIVWPEFAEETWESPPSCIPHVLDSSITLEVPTPKDEECANVINHGDAEEGTRNFWMHSGGGIEMYTPGYNSAFAFRSTRRKGTWQGPGQFLDTRCLTSGSQYEISAMVKLEDNNGVPQNCNPNQENINAFDICPRVSLRLRHLAGNKIGDPVDVSYAYPLATTVGPYNKDDWNMIYGVFTVTESIASADTVFFFIDRARPGVNIIIDDVKMVPTVQTCQSPIYNTDFETGDARFWGKVGTTTTDMFVPGYPNLPGASTEGFALRTFSRKEFWASMSQPLNTDCLEEGTAYSVSSNILLLDANGNIANCDTSLEYGAITVNVCPKMALKITTGNVEVDVDIADVTGPWNQGNWNSMNGIFTVTQEMLVADSVRLFWRKYEEGHDIVVDNVAVTSVEAQDPDKLMNNGDFSSGDTRHFKPDRGGVISIYAGGYDDDFALIMTGRDASYYGVRQNIDTNVLEEGVSYTASAKFKLFLPDGTTPFDCEPTAVAGEKICPVMYLKAQEPGVGSQTRLIGSTLGEKDADWNTIAGNVVFFHNEINAPSLTLIIDRAPAGIVMVLDNVGVTKVTSTA